MNNAWGHGIGPFEAYRVQFKNLTDVVMILVLPKQTPLHGASETGFV
jgi:hypothetical protein